MSAEEIKSLPIDDLATEDAILFLWATVPNLPLALNVLESWGFAYKSHIVWDKVHIGTGYHTRNQHELLLIGRRGELPLPEPADIPASVVRIERSAHSEKPAEFAALIERMYAGLPRIELFARAARHGWERWGYESPTEFTVPVLDAFFNAPVVAPENVSVKAKPSVRFIPPTLPEVAAYMTEIGIGHMAEEWMDHYEANGWKVGKVAMKDWRAACRTWKRSEYAKPAPAAPKPTRPPRIATPEEREIREEPAFMPPPPEIRKRLAAMTGIGRDFPE